MRTRTVTATVAWMLAVAALGPAPGRADTLVPFQGGPQEVTLQDVVPRIDRGSNGSNEFFSEWWSFIFRLDGKYGAYAQFLVSNLGPGDGKGAVSAELELPDGTKLSETTELEFGKWTWAKDRFELRFGENTVGGPLDGLKLRLKNESFEAEYDLESIAQPWKPGSGRAQYGTPDRYYEFHVIAPVARVTGRVRPAGEDWRPVKGIMYVDHSVSTIGMHEQAKRWMRFRALDPDRTFLMADIRPPDLYGDVPIQYAVLFEKGRKAFESWSFDVTFGNRMEDPRKGGYVVQRLVELRQEGDAGQARGAVKATKMTGREDYLETVGAAARFVLAKFAKPIMYYFDGLYAIEIKDGAGKVRKWGGPGSFYYTIVNP